jgi:hypothetical protein
MTVVTARGALASRQLGRPGPVRRPALLSRGFSPVRHGRGRLRGAAGRLAPVRTRSRWAQRLDAALHAVAALAPRPAAKTTTKATEAGPQQDAPGPGQRRSQLLPAGHLLICGDPGEERQHGRQLRIRPAERTVSTPQQPFLVAEQGHPVPPPIPARECLRSPRRAAVRARQPARTGHDRQRRKALVAVGRRSALGHPQRRGKGRSGGRAGIRRASCGPRAGRPLRRRSSGCSLA